MKRLLLLVLIVMLCISLITSCNTFKSLMNGSSGKGNKGTGSVLNLKDEDPCECCPECKPEECDCDECDCCPPGGGSKGSYTYIVEITAYVAGWRPIHKTHGTATVTMENSDGSGYFGGAEGKGEYTEEMIPETGQVEKTFSFNVQLLNFDPQTKKSITVGINRIGAEEVTNYSKDDPSSGSVKLPDMGNVIMMILAKECFDAGTGFYNFELPLENGSAHKVFNFDQATQDFEGHVELTIFVTPSP